VSSLYFVALVSAPLDYSEVYNVLVKLWIYICWDYSKYMGGYSCVCV